MTGVLIRRGEDTRAQKGRKPQTTEAETEVLQLRARDHQEMTKKPPLFHLIEESLLTS